MNNIVVNLMDFSAHPGPRSKDTGDHSGEQFFEEVLDDKFYDALMKDAKLVVDIDGTAGIAASFLDEAFGRLAHKYLLVNVEPRLEIVSDEEPYLIEDIKDSMREWSQDGPHENSNLVT